jgi:hypothetical protein
MNVLDSMSSVYEVLSLAIDNPNTDGILCNPKLNEIVEVQAVKYKYDAGVASPLIVSKTCSAGKICTKWDAA